MESNHWCLMCDQRFLSSAVSVLSSLFLCLLARQCTCAIILNFLLRQTWLFHAWQFVCWVSWSFSFNGLPDSIVCFCCLPVLLFGQDARSSKSNFIGCFDPNCHVSSVIEGTCDSFQTRRNVLYVSLLFNLHVMLLFGSGNNALELLHFGNY